MVSVCMASYNGEKFISEQIESIIKQLHKNDELIISDDGSTDSTVSIIKEFQKNHPSIVLIDGPRNGVVKNFENALTQAKGEYIFLTDQDDIWSDNKVSSTLSCFGRTNCDLVLHDAAIVNQNGQIIERSFFCHRKSKIGYLNNLIKNSYIGCCMAFKRDILQIALPFPNNIEMHDWWIGVITEKVGKTMMLEEPLLFYRRHGNNVSSFQHHPLPKMIKNRLYLLVQVHKRLRRM